MATTTFLALTVACQFAWTGPRTATAPPELGLVAWGTDLDQAMTRAAATGRPILVLFQEIPGCATCVDFGRGCLSTPLLVEAIEDLFVPVAIHNNRPGRDAEICRTYGEPSWNYPVMRFLDAEGHDLIPRRDGVYSTGGAGERMITALRTAGRPVPGYLELAVAETAPARRETATFAMHCFWEGEARLGALDGVLATRAGWLEGHEVVEVVFDGSVIAYERLVEAAANAGCAERVYAHDDVQLAAARRIVGDGAAGPRPAPARDAKAPDRKYALHRSTLRFLPLTVAQATRVNAALQRGKSPAAWLSPRQLALAARIAAAMERDPASLEGLRPPADPAGLAEYEARLRERLRDAE